MINHLLSTKTQQIFKQPKVQKEFGTIDVPDENWAHQIDVLFLPADSKKGTKYALNVVDVYSRKVDGRPIGSLKMELCTHALDDIYNESMSLSKPRCIIADHQFDNPIFKKWCADNGINLQISQVNRHQQLAQVERLNKTLGTWIFQIETEQELKTGKPNTDWIGIYHQLLDIINKARKTPKQQDNSNDDIIEDKTNTLLLPGTKVYLKIPKDEAQDVRGNRLHGTLRDADPKWKYSPTYTVVNYSLIPNQPTLYCIRNNKTNRIVDDALYSRESLQVVKK